MRTTMAAAAILVMAAAGAARADYTTIDLTPAGSTDAEATAIVGNQVSGYADVSGITHGFIWTLPSTTGVDLQPSSAGPTDTSQVNGAELGTQAGNVVIGPNEHGAIWNGTAGSFMRLNETGFSTRSSAAAVGGGVVVGYGLPDLGSQLQATVWTNPTNALTAPVGLPTSASYIASAANWINGNRVVGFAADATTGLNHAAMWDISNIASPVFTDIQPADFMDSQAQVAAGNQIAGYGDNAVSGLPNAILWTVSAVDSSVTSVDLHPAGFLASAAFSTNGVEQVGFAVKDGHDFAMLWSGTAGSAVDLSQYLPAGEYTDSQALSIDAAGDISGFATDTDGNVHAVVWEVPEPGAGILLGVGVMGLLRRRRVRGA